MFEDEYVLPTNVEKDREFVETFDPSRERRSRQKMYDHVDPFASGRVQKRILDVLGSRFFHDIFPFRILSLYLRQELYQI